MIQNNKTNHSYDEEVLQIHAGFYSRVYNLDELVARPGTVVRHKHLLERVSRVSLARGVHVLRDSVRDSDGR